MIQPIATPSIATSTLFTLRALDTSLPPLFPWPLGLFRLWRTSRGVFLCVQSYVWVGLVSTPDHIKSLSLLLVKTLHIKPFSVFSVVYDACGLVGVHPRANKYQQSSPLIKLGVRHPREKEGKKETNFFLLISCERTEAMEQNKHTPDKIAHHMIILFRCVSTSGSRAQAGSMDKDHVQHWWMWVCVPPTYNILLNLP